LKIEKIFIDYLKNFMKVHVGINSKNKSGFLKQLKLAKEALPRGTWLHVDVSDPRFSKIKSYFNANILKKYSGNFNFEAHLMMPGKKISGYLKKPFKKIFVHMSAVKDWAALIKEVKKSKISLGAVISVNEEKYKNKIPKSIRSIMVLAVTPGPSGQKFGSKALKLISFLRKKYPHAIITVDGGITPKIVERVKQKGVSEIVSTSYIWNSDDPLKAYKELRAI
jgi:pentose-5-phosphate-3-epimerase